MTGRAYHKSWQANDLRSRFMANYHETCIAEVIDPERVGVSTGETAAGELRICISLEGRAINTGIDPTWQRINWRSLTPACAAELHHLLEMLRHLWDGRPVGYSAPMPTQYRSKESVLAVLWNGSNLDEVAKLFHDCDLLVKPGGLIFCHASIGDAEIDNYIVRNGAGDIRAMTPKDFDARYTADLIQP